MNPGKQYDFILFFRDGMPIVIAWIFLLIIAGVYSALGVVFDRKERKEQKTVIEVSIHHSNRYMATMFITAWLILSFIMYRWIL